MSPKVVEKLRTLGREVIIITLYFDNLSLNPAEVYNFSCSKLA